MYSEQLKAMKQRKNISASEIAQKSGIPESTVSRILNGQTENPTFVTIVAIVKAMGGSLDELVGIEHPAPEAKCCTINEELTSALREKIADAKEQVTELKQENAHRRKVITLLIIILFAFVLLVAVVAGLFLWYDLTHGDIGFFFRDVLSGKLQDASFI